MRILKWALGAVVGIIAIVLAGVAALTLFIDPNTFKPEIIKVVKQQTGRELTIAGDLGWSFFPSLGVNIGKTELANAAGFSAPFFAKVDKASVSVKILPLFSGSVQIGTIYLDGVAANLETDASGKNNWDDLAGTSQEKSPSQEQGAQSPVELLQKLRLNGIDIQHLALSYHNQQNGSRVAVDNLYFKTGAVVLGQPINLSGGLIVKSSEQNLNAKLDFASLLNYQLDTAQLELERFSAQLGASASALGKHHLQVKLDTHGLIDLKNTSVNLPKIVLALDESTLTGDLQFQGGDKLNIQTHLSLDGIDIDDYLSKLPKTAAAPASTTPKTQASDKIALPVDLLKKLIVDAQLNIGSLKVADTQISNLSTTISAKDGLLAIKPLKLTAMGATLTSSASLNVQAKVPAYTLSAELSKLELLPLLKQFAGTDILSATTTAKIHASTQGDSVSSLTQNLHGTLENLALNGTLTSPELPQPVQLALAANAEIIGKKETIQLNSLKAGIDNTKIDGSASVVGFKTPQIQFKVAVDDLNLDHYLKPASAPKTAKEPAKPSDPDAPLLPVQLLQSLNLDGSLTIGKLQVMNSKSQNIRADLRAKDGLITLKPLAMQLYSGNFNGSATIDARSDNPKLALNSQLSQVQINPLLQDIAKLDFLAGLAGAHLNISARGNTTNSLLGSLNGDWDLSLAKGELKSNLLSGLAPFLKLSNKPALTAAAERATTPFETLKSSGKVKDGVITTNDFALQSGASQFSGGGSLDIGKQYLDFGLDVAHDQYRCTIPVKGKIASINYSKLAANAVPNCLKDAAKAQAQQKLDSEKAKLQQKADEEKAKLQAKADAEKAKLKAKADAEKAKLQRKIDAEKQRAEDKVKDKLKDLFK